MLRAFISYSNKNEELKDDLLAQLSILKRTEKLDSWDYRRIEGGREFRRAIIEAIHNSEIFLLLVSPYFFASQFCLDEMEMALEKHRLGLAKVIPIILEDCNWTETKLGKLEAWPDDGNPITEFENIHQPLASIVRKLQEVIDESWYSKEITVSPDGFGNCETIQEAIEQSSEKTKIIVMPGEYDECISIKDKDIFIEGKEIEGGIPPTVNSQIDQPCFSNHSGRLTIKNLILNQKSKKETNIPAVLANKGSIFLINSKVKSSSEIGCVANERAKLMIFNSKVSTPEGFGIMFLDEAIGVVENCELKDCYTGIFLDSSGKTKISHNKIDETIEGVRIEQKKDIYIRENTIQSCRFGVVTKRSIFNLNFDQQLKKDNLIEAEHQTITY